jgi:hypothetical protein
LILCEAGVIDFVVTGKSKAKDFVDQLEGSPARMNELAAILCPDSSAPEKRLKVILSFFGSVQIGIPWFMDERVPLSQSGAVGILRPPPELRPSRDFAALLAEYRRWIRTSRDRGFDAFLAFKEQESHGEEATWQIREELRHGGGRPDHDQTRNALKWNLYLHLAREIEEKKHEAEELLKALKTKDSPLKGVTEEETASGPLSDLPEGEDSTALSEGGRTQVLEAWFSLFEGHLRGEGVLLTLSPAMFQHMSDTWEEWAGAPAYTEMEIRVPDFSRLGLPELFEARSRFQHSREGAVLKEAAVEFLSGHREASREEMGEIDLSSFAAPRVIVRLRRFPLLERTPVHEIVRHLSGKSMGFIREEHTFGE